MSTLPSQQNAPTRATEVKFNRLASAWIADTAYVSSSTELESHAAFQEMVQMGSAIVPLLLRELESGSPGHWHRALRQITRVDPVPSSERGSIDKAAAAWLRWGNDQGYQW